MTQLDPARDRWNQDPERAERCNFPVLSDNWTGHSDDAPYSLEFRLGAKSTLDDFTQHTGIAISSAIQAAWALTLRSYVGSDSVCFGVKQQDSVEWFACAVEVRPRDTCLSLLGEIQLWNQSCSNREPRELSGKQKALDTESASPLFNSAVNFTCGPAQSYSKTLDVEIRVDLDTGTASFNSRISLISRAQAGNIIGTVEQALCTILQKPRSLVLDVDLFTDQHAALVDSWCNSELELRNECVHDPILRHCQRSPHALAISSWDEGEWSYREIQQHVDALANMLIGMEIGKGARIAILFGKSAWSVVAILASLKIGGTVVPLEPSQPKLRLRRIVEDTGVKLALTSDEHLSLLQDSLEQILTVGRDTLHNPSQSVPEIPLSSPDAIAFILSTSGSTGQPKGVMITHQAFSTALNHMADQFKLDGSTRTLQFASFSYIVALFEVFFALFTGGTLAIPSLQEKEDNLTKCLTDWRINFTILTPSILKRIDPDKIPHLRTVAAAGEPMRPEIICKFSGQVRLLNFWGSTEAVLVAVSDPMLRPSQAIEGGHCLGNYRVVEIEDHRRQVPIGALGEMVFQAPWISEGYVNDPELTAKSFISVAKWRGLDQSHFKSRWYRTGDLVRQNSDGSLILAGRQDSMVKLRGQRVNLSEVSRRVSADAAVDEFTVFVPVDGLCQRRLVAAVVFKNEALPSTHGLSQELDEVELLQGHALEAASRWVEETKVSLTQLLPTYMIPTVWLLLTRMPLTASKKTDQIAIKRFVSEMSLETFAEITTMSLKKEEPVTSKEKAIQAVWSSVLKIPLEQIPRNQSFLALGGDSLSAMSVGAQCKLNGMGVTVQDILRYSTVAEIAAHVSEAGSGVDLKMNVEWQKIRAETHRSIVERGLFQSSEIEDAYPCTPVQQGMLLSQYRRTGDYDVMEIFEQTNNGTLSADRIQSAWHAVVAGHSALRTVFIESTRTGGFFDQVVLAAVQTQVTIIKDEISEDASSVFAQHPPRSYVEKRPSHDLTIFQTKAGKIYLRFHIHHTLIDGTSMGIILRDLANAYDNSTKRPQGAFGGYVGYLSSLTLQNSVEYWIGALEGVKPCCIPELVDEVPTSNQLESISAEVAESSLIFEFCKLEQITLPSLLKAIWACVLSVYTGSDDVCFGYLTSGRDSPLDGIEDAVGPFINMLLCKMCVDRRSILHISRSEQKQYLRNLPHQHCSLAEIQHALGFSGQRLFNTTLSMFRSFTADSDRNRTVQLQKLMSNYPTEFDVSIVIQTSRTSISIDLSYWTGSVSTSHAKHLLEAFMHGMISAVRSPESPASAVDLVGSESFVQMTRWNPPRARVVEACVHDLITAQAAKSPDATAIEAWDGNLAFNELDRLSNIVANRLVTIGVRPERHVILCSEKRLLAIVSIVAVLKAGGSVVCVDPANPKARSQKIADDTSPACILASPLHAQVFQGEGFSETVLIVDDIISDPSGDASAIDSPVRPNNSALVLFTSGSTGIPKGIVHEHRSIVTSLFAHCEQLHLDSNARVLQFSAFTFDASFTETFTALIFGGCLVVPSEEERLGDLESVISKHTVNWAILTPTVASMLHPEYIPSLEKLILTGELLKDSSLTIWSKHVDLTNLYGPAEIMHVTTLQLKLRSDDRVRDIGRGVAVSTWIVDPEDPERLVPIGAIGELVVEGPIIAREYLKDPVTTIKAFVRTPKWRENDSNAPARFYRTGDLVRYNSDGSLYLLGRRDTQIKLYGQRVELEELEFQLKRGSQTIGGLGNSAVIYSKAAATQTDGMLAAVVEVEDGIITNTVSKLLGEEHMAKLAELKRYITKAVPRYMVPSLYIPVGSMPQLTSGKLDRKVLTSMVAELSQDDMLRFSLAGDRTHAKKPFAWMQRILARLWHRVLNFPLEKICADDHFFRLGGDSVCAMKLSALAREENLSISVAAIFQEPTMTRMASVVSLFSERSLQKLDKQYGLTRAQVQDIYPCTTTQTGLVLSSLAQRGTCISTHVLELSGVDIDLFKLAWTRVQANNELLRTRIVDLGGIVGHVQVLTKQEQALHIEDSTLATYLWECKQFSFEYGQPLNRACLIQNDNGDWHFVWTAHQSIYDHRSLEYMFHKIWDLYQSFRDKIDPPSEANGLFYKSYVDHTLQCNIPDAEEYWKRVLFNPNISSYPATSHTSVQPFADSVVHHSISFHSGSLSSNVLQGAWALLLSKYAGYSEHVVFGITSDINNESLPRAGNTTGPTTTVIPMVVSLYGGDTVEMYLESIEAFRKEAKLHRHFGLQNIKMLSASSQDVCNFGSFLSVNSVRSELYEESRGRLFTVPAPATYPITLECQVDHDRVEITAQFDNRIISTDQMQRMLWQFAHIARQMMEKRTMKLDEIETFSPEDAQDLGRQNSLMPQKVKSTIHELIATQISSRPTAEALCCHDESITYLQLGEYSERLAFHLQSEYAIKAGSVVPLAFSRSPWAIIAMLAISKLGGIFLPLDPSYPSNRLRQITESTDVSLVLCSSDHEDLAKTLSATTLIFDAERVLSMPLTQRKEFLVASDDIAYLIFTSGSTGKPKGIPVEHGSFCTAAIDLGDRLNLNSNSRAFHFASYAFDASLADSLIVLVKGGCVCIPAESERLGETSKSMRDLGVNWADFTPSFIRTIDPAQVPRLETLILGGEKMGLDNVALWSDRVRLTNVYGPAETCFATAVHAPVRSGDPPDLIGTSCVGSIWIVDPNDVRKLAPVGCIGELVIEGAAVGRGYLDPARTEEAFHDNPRWLSTKDSISGSTMGLSNGHVGHIHGNMNGSLKTAVEQYEVHANGGTLDSQENKKVYRTGDLGRYDLSDGFNGRVRIVGRKDTQVKIRGQRVELGDIEQHIKSGLPEAKHVAVEQVSIPSRRQEKIAAFLCIDEVAHADTLLQPLQSNVRQQISQLENTLRETIPSYMVPALYILLSQMPRSASGKTDRNKLREIVATFTLEELAHYSLMEITSSMPETESEKLLAAVWSDTLNIPMETVGKEDSFFKLGGDSIAALRMTTAARASGLQLTVAQVFKAPRLDQLASRASVADESAESEIEAYSLLRESEVPSLLSQIEPQYGILRSEIQDILPMTPLQEGLMLLSLKTPGSYVSQTVLSLQPHVDLERFQLAWRHVARRNAILRTTFVHTGLHSFQIIRKEQFEWQEVLDDVESFLQKDKARQLRHGDPMTRYSIITDRDGIKTFVLTAHHSLYDGWSMKVIFEEADKLYKSQEYEKTSTPPQFSGFIAHLANLDREDERRFWVSQFTGKDLATYPDPSTATRPEAETRLHHHMDLVRPSGSEVTMSNIIRAAWAMVVARHANTQDVYFGAVLMGRNAPLLNIERMAGPTITTVPLRISIDQDQTVESFLRAVKEQSIEMIPYEHTGLQNIKNISSEANRACNFQNLLVIQPAGADHIDSNLWNEKAIFARGEMVTLTYSLILECQIYKDSIRIGAQFRKSELPSEHIERILHQFEAVLHQLNSEGDYSTKSLQSISLCSPEDLSEVTSQNATSLQRYKKLHQCIHRNVESVVASQPERLAIASWDGHFTYSELNALATRVAHRLRSFGVGPEVFVSLCFDKSAWATVAMLAVLKAGGAYFCLDPKHPLERKEIILTDTQSRIILVGEQYAHMYDSDEYRVVVIGSTTTREFPMKDSDPCPEVDLSNAAFLIFTSGSTGVPKGIVMEHGSYCSSASEHCKALNITSESRVMQFANYTYDVSVGEIFSTLMQGGCVCIPSEMERLGDLAGAISALKANWMFLTPTVAAFLRPEQVPTLNHLVLGGEHCTQDNIDSWSDRICLINSYGPAECSIWCACNPGVTKDDDPSNLGEQIGATLWIVDPDDPNQLAPIGTIGELAVEGPTLAREYWNDPLKTADAFIKNPTWAIREHGQTRRIYRTGDLVRYNPEGALHIVGRKDHQVKLRGQRIELGEIEYHLSRLLPSEQYCVVEVLRPSSGERDAILSAFISSRTFSSTEVTDGAIQPMSSQLRSIITDVQTNLNNLLPAHMIPTTYLCIGQLPMSSGGKVDRKKLREIGETLSLEDLYAYTVDDGNSDVRMVTTDMERTLQAFWTRVLGLEAEDIGKDSNFFRNGGDSISAMKLSAAIRRDGILLSVQEIFAKPILEGMAMAMTTVNVKGDKNPPSTKMPIQKFALLGDEDTRRSVIDAVSLQLSTGMEEVQDILPTTDYQRWTFGCNQLKTRGYLNFFKYNIKGDLDVSRLRAACHQVVIKHPILRTECVAFQERLLQAVTRARSMEDMPFLAVESQSAAMDDSSNHPATFGTQIVRFYLVHVSSNEYILLMRISHALYDGISLPMILEDMKRAYSGYELSERASFHSFLQGTIEGTPVIQAEDFFRDLLAGSQMTDVVTHHGPSFAASVDRSLKKSVRAQKHLLSQGTTFATIAKAAWSIVLSQLSSTSDIVFGQVSSGRNTAIEDIETIVGPCMNLLPVRVNTAEHSTFASLLDHLQTQHLAAIPFENLGFQQIIERCTDWPKWSRFSSVLQHTNFNVGIEEAETRGDLTWRIEGISPEHDVSDVWIWTGPQGDHEFYIDFTYSSATMPSQIASQLLEMFCDIFEKIAKDPSAKISSELSSRDKILPLSGIDYFKDDEVSPSLQPDPSIDACVKDVWSRVFGAAGAEILSQPASQTPYYEIRGDLIAAAQLAAEYQKQGYDTICVEDIVQNPSVTQQCGLLQARREQAPREASEDRRMPS